MFQSTESSQPPTASPLGATLTERDSGNDIDYFEKFTLVDVVGPGDRAPEEQGTGQSPATATAERPKAAKETAKDSLPAPEDSFVIVSDVDIVGEHLDEVFYGEGAPAAVLQQRECEAECGAGTRSRRESQRSAKESGSVLFETEETTLTPIYISPGPPKIIDPILLEEPTAMSFMYSDLYEDAVGERRRSDEEQSESGSVASQETSRRRLSDSEEADGYLEKFILKDETPTVEVPPESAEDRREGRMMWAQSKFEMTGCLTRVVKEEDEVKRETEETKEQDVTAEGGEGDPKGATLDGRTTEKQSSKETSIQELKVRDEEVKCDASSSSGGECLPVQPISSEDEKSESLHADQSCQGQGGAQILHEGFAKVSEEGAGVTTEILTAGAQDTFTSTEKDNSAETSQSEETEAAASAGPEVTADSDATALVEGGEKPLEEEDLHDGLHVELQEAGSTEEEGHRSVGDMHGAESLEPELLLDVELETEGDEDGVATGPEDSVATRPVTSEEAGSSPERSLHESRPHPEETLLVREAKDEDKGNSLHEKTSAEDFVLLVPKGQAVEMDIEISRFPKTTTDDSQCGDPTPLPVTMETESLHPPDNWTMAEPQLEGKANDDQEQKSPSCPPAPAEDASANQEKVDKYESVRPSLWSFTPQEDLSRLEEDMHSEAKHEGKEVEMSKTFVDEERWIPEADEDGEAKLKADSPDVNVEELDYEVICEQEAQELVEAERQRGAEEPEPEPEPEAQMGLIDLSPSEEEHIEDDYEFFDAEEERQARLAAELQGLDWFCFTCGDLLSTHDRASEEHRNHQVIDVDAAYEQMKVKHNIMG